METNAKFLSTLGMCRKAGKLVMGFDAVARTIKSGKAGLLVLAGDISPKSAKEITRLAETYQVKIARVETAMDDIKRIAGKKAGILAITDEGLAKSVAASSKARQVEEESV